MNLQLIWTHTKALFLELVRQPAYVVSTVAFPALFYMIFAVPESKSVGGSNFLMASFCGFAVFGVVFLQLGVGLAQERVRPWSHFLKTLPLPVWASFVARFLTGFAFSILAAATIVGLSLIFTEAKLTQKEWILFSTTLFLGSLTFSSMGIALGYWSTEKTSLPIGNLIYLPLSFVGGLWKPPEILPESLKTISAYLPTRYYGNLLWAAVQDAPLKTQDFVGLSGYFLIAMIIAAWGYRRDVQSRR